MKRIFHTLLLSMGISSIHAEPLLKSDLSDVTIEGPKGCWSYAGGLLRGTNVPTTKTSNLWTNRQFEDFTLVGEFKISAGTDSGLYLRTKDEEIQIGVSSSLKRDMSCSPFDGKAGRYPVEAGIQGVLNKDGWNAFVVTVRGRRYQIALNGKPVLDYTSETEVEAGPIGFQAHAGRGMIVEFRKLDVTPLPKKQWRFSRVSYGNLSAFRLSSRIRQP